MKKIIFILFLFPCIIYAQDSASLKTAALKIALETNVPEKQKTVFVQQYVNFWIQQNNARKGNPINVGLPYSNICVPTGFENNLYTGWQVRTYYRGANSNIVDLPATGNTSAIIPFAATYVNPYPNNTPYEVVIESTGNDPILGNRLSKVHSGNNSIRINGMASNAGPHNSVEAIVKTIKISSTNNKFNFHYAIVLQNPVGHIISGNDFQPYLWIRVNRSSGSIISLPVNGQPTPLTADATNPFFNDTTYNNEALVWRDWSCAEIDLSFIPNDEIVQVEFLMADCGMGGHFAYAYFDDFCVPCSSKPNEGSITITDINNNCGTPLIVKGKYELPYTNGAPSSPNGILNNITVEFYNNGLPSGYNYTIPTSDINNATKAFSTTIPASFASSLPNACYDLVLKANFSVPNKNGSGFYTFVMTSAIGGWMAGLNNDWCMDCPCICPPKPTITLTQIGRPGVIKQLNCGGTEEIECNKLYSLSIDPACQPANCSDKRYEISVRANGGPTQTFINQAVNIQPLATDKEFTITIKTYCGGRLCTTCTITLTVKCKCPPPPCCKTPVGTEFNAALSTITQVGGNSFANLSFNLNGNGKQYTQVRASVVSFGITADDRKCLECYNNSRYWASIAGGILTGVQGFSRVISGDNNGVNTNTREVTYTSSTPQIINTAQLTLNLMLPSLQTLSCCNMYATVYIKFTYRDNQCNECEKIIGIKIPLNGQQGKQPELINAAANIRAGGPVK